MKIPRFLVALLVVFGGGSLVSADLLVLNSGFQNPNAGGGFTSGGNVPSWTASGWAGSGIDTNNYFSGGDGSNQYFYGDGGSGRLSQNLGVTFTANTIYKVNINGGNRSGDGVGAASIKFGLESSSGAVTSLKDGFVSLPALQANPNTWVAASSGLNGSSQFVYGTGTSVPTGNVVAFLEHGGQSFLSGRVHADNFQVTTTEFITPVDAKSTSNFIGATSSTKLIDSSGLSENTIQGLHNNSGSAGDMWHAGNVSDGLAGGPTGFPPTVSGQKVLFDLGKLYDLKDVYVWNHNQAGLTDRGVKDLEIFTSADNSVFTSAGNFQFAQALGGGEKAQNFGLLASNARYVRFDIISAWSGAANDYVGLSEVRFGGLTAVPEPTSCALLACGALTMLAVRKRRKLSSTR